jgi:hypothetical protein
MLDYGLSNATCEIPNHAFTQDTILTTNNQQYLLK